MAGEDILRKRMRKNTWNILKPGELERFKGFAAQFPDTELGFEPMASAYAMPGRVVMGERLVERLSPIETQSVFLHEYGHTKLLGGSRPYDDFVSFNHWMEFRSDTFAAAMQGNTRGMKGALAGMGTFPELMSSLNDSKTHPSIKRRLGNLDQFDSVIREIGQDKTIPAKLAHLSREDQRLARKLLPFEVHSARTLNPNLKKRFNGSKSQ